MSDFYTELAATATELLAEFGTMLTLHRPGAGRTYDPVTGRWTESEPPSEVAFMGLKMSPTQEYAASMAQGSVHARDMLVLMEPNVVEPKMDDSIEIDSEVWQIVNVRTERPADVTLYHLVQVRP